MSDIARAGFRSPDSRASPQAVDFLWRRARGGRGLAKAILFNERARDQFSAFFARSDTLLWVRATAAR